MRNSIGISAIALVVTCLSASPAWAQLGGLLDIDTDDGLNVNLLDDTANVKIGGGGGNVVDADVAGGAVEAEVNTSDGVDADVRLLDDSAGANVRLGGSDGSGVTVRLGGDGDSGGGGGSGGGGSGGGGSGGGGSGGGGSGGGGGNSDGGAGGGLTVGNIGGSSSGDDALPCFGPGTPIFRQLSNISYSESTVARWANASNVQFVRVSACPGVDGQLGSGLFNYVAPSVPVLQAALSRSPYAPGDVLGIIQSGSTLRVYVD